MRLTEQNVKEVIVDASMKKAVFVYFFMNAPECEAATKAVTAAITDNNEYISRGCIFPGGKESPEYTLLEGAESWG